MKDSEHDRRLDEGDLHDEQQDAIINQLSDLVEKNKKEIGGLVEEIYSLSALQKNVTDIEEKSKGWATKKQLCCFAIVSVISFVIGIIQLFL